MRKLIFNILIFLGTTISVFGQMVVELGAVDKATLVSIASGMGVTVEKISQEQAEKILEGTQHVLDEIGKAKKVIKQINSVGNVAYKAGQNVQDMIDTSNEISELFGGSPITTKSLEQMTHLDIIKSDENLRKIKEKSSKFLGDIKNLGNNTKDRIDNVFGTVDSVLDALNEFDINVNDPNLAVLKDVQKGIEITNRQISNLVGVINGQNALNSINTELDIAEKNLTDAKASLIGKKLQDEKKIYDKIYESNNIISIEDLDLLFKGVEEIKNEEPTKTEIDNAFKKSFKKIFNW